MATKQPKSKSSYKKVVKGLSKGVGFAAKLALRGTTEVISFATEAAGKTDAARTIKKKGIAVSEAVEGGVNFTGEVLGSGVQWCAEKVEDMLEENTENSGCEGERRGPRLKDIYAEDPHFQAELELDDYYSGYDYSRADESFDPPPSHSTYTKIVGVTFKNDDGTDRQELLKRCRVGQKLQLIPDPNNPHDKNAVKVCTFSGEQLGFLSRQDAAQFVQTMKAFTSAEAEITELTGGTPGKPNLGCNIKITYFNEMPLGDKPDREEIVDMVEKLIDNAIKSCPKCGESIVFRTLCCEFCHYTYDLKDYMGEIVTKRGELFEEITGPQASNSPIWKNRPPENDRVKQSEQHESDPWWSLVRELIRADYRDATLYSDLSHSTHPFFLHTDFLVQAATPSIPIPTRSRVGTTIKGKSVNSEYYVVNYLIDAQKHLVIFSRHDELGIITMFDLREWSAKKAIHIRDTIIDLIAKKEEGSIEKHIQQTCFRTLSFEMDFKFLTPMKSFPSTKLAPFLYDLYSERSLDLNTISLENVEEALK